MTRSLLFLFFSLLAIRLQMVADLQIPLKQWIEMRLYQGVLFDLALGILLMGLVQLVGVLPRVRKVWFEKFLWCCFITIAFVGTLSNAIYYKFFHSPLNLKTVFFHWEDMFLVKDVGAGLAVAPGTVGALVLWFVALVTAVTAKSDKSSRTRERTSAHRPSRVLRLTGAILTLALGVLLKQSPIWLRNLPGGPTILGHQIVLDWLIEGSERVRWMILEGTGVHARAKLPQGIRDPGKSDVLPVNETRALLAQYRDWGKDNPTSGVSRENPLLRTIRVSDQQMREARKRWGLPLEGPVSVVILLVESFRSFELFHPHLGPLLAPELLSVLKKHSVVFDQAYSSSMEAGMTVRGQFATFCSMIDNLQGVATYLAYPELNIRCLHEGFRERGYEMAWVNSFQRSFHNKERFESLHGMTRFFDMEYFRTQGFKVAHGWGMKDGEFLDGSLGVIKMLGNAAQPIFAHLLTTGTHVPYRVLDDGPVPLELQVGGEYEKWLSRYRAAGMALAKFIQDLFNSEIGERVFLVLAADHGAPILPPQVEMKRRLGEEWKTDFEASSAAGELRRREIYARIPIALLSKKMKPARFSQVVHAIDIAPTVAEVVGGEWRDVTWLGRPLQRGGSGSPWVFLSSEGIHFRTRDERCFSVVGETETRCLDVRRESRFKKSRNLPSLHDPLYVEDKEWSEIVQAAKKPSKMNHPDFFTRVAKAIRSAIENDQLR